MMSLSSLRALSVAVLHCLIAVHAEGWTPLSAQEHAATGCTHRAPDGGLHTVPDYTGDFNALMPLVLRYGITQYCRGSQHWEFWQDRTRGEVCVVLCATDEAQHRRCLAELVLYVAMQGEA